MESMTRPASYAVGLLHDIQPGQGLQTYLSGIDATLAPYGGSFLIHGGSPRVVEGSLPFGVIVIGFPDADGAQHWYDSPAYQQLAALRRTFAQGAVVLCRGEDAGHRALDILFSRGGGALMIHHVTEDGTRLVLDDLGEGDPVVLLHGWSLDRTCWEHQVPALRVCWRHLVPGALAVAAGTLLLVKLSNLVLPGQIDEQVAEYGLIGAVFVLSIWLMVLSAVLLGGTLLGAVLIQRRAQATEARAPVPGAEAAGPTGAHPTANTVP